MRTAQEELDHIIQDNKRLKMEVDHLKNVIAIHERMIESYEGYVNTTKLR